MSEDNSKLLDADGNSQLAAENKTFEETIVAGNMEEANKTAQESNPEVKIVSANWVYK